MDEARGAVGVKGSAIAQHVSDLGGADNISNAEQALVRDRATLIVELERREGDAPAQAGEIDDTALSIYASTTNSLHRVLAALGLQRRARQIGPSLGEVLRGGIERQRKKQTARLTMLIDAGDGQSFVAALADRRVARAFVESDKVCAAPGFRNG